MRRFALLVLACTLSACDSTDDTPRLSGLYVYSTTETDVTPTATVTLALDLSSSGGSFALGPRSYYRIQGASEARASVTGAGTYTHPAITVSLDRIDLGQGFVLDAASLTGTVSDGGDTVALSAEGETLVLRRQ